jgi:hypothetical protein
MASWSAGLACGLPAPTAAPLPHSARLDGPVGRRAGRHGRWDGARQAAAACAKARKVGSIEFSRLVCRTRLSFFGVSIYIGAVTGAAETTDDARRVC